MSVGIVWGALPAAAQPVTVQQPVVGSFSVNTTVSVPDRGGVHLGSVNAAAAGRTVLGPLPSGPSVGLQTRGSSVSTTVFIHDLRAMDEALLTSRPGEQAESPWAQRLAERRSLPSPAVAAQATPSPSRAGQWEALAQQAESRGKPQVALVYWRLAAKEGSERAAARLTAATRQPLSAPSTGNVAAAGK
uniref:Uncharacterized protein n=1 Tax=Schlesneria paludicola TaxID=360056 RepID=A0A7C4QS32_9PLAN